MDYLCNYKVNITASYIQTVNQQFAIEKFNKEGYREATFADRDDLKKIREETLQERKWWIN